MNLPRFSHIVVFTLKDASEEAIERLLADCNTYLSGHDGMVFYAAGTLADMHRDVNDRDFDVALTTVFQDKAAHDAYQVSDRHQEFIARGKSNWERVRVFDSQVSAE